MNNQSWLVAQMKELGMLCFVCATFTPEDRSVLYRGGIPAIIVMHIKAEDLEPVLSYYLEEMGLEPVVGFNNERLWFATNRNNPNFDRFWTIAEDIPTDSMNNLSHWQKACAAWEAS